MPSPLPASRPGSSRFIPPRRGGFTHRHLFARPQITDMVNVPVIAAGGIADARGVIAALALGAEAVANGNGIPGVRGVRPHPPSSPGLRGKKAGHTALTKAFTGRLARGIPNRCWWS